MTTSGTTTFDLDLVGLGEEAFEQAGLEIRGGYDYRTMRRSLDLLMLEWANKGINLWKVEQGSQVLTAGTATYTLANNVVDLLDQVIRTGTGLDQGDIEISRIPIGVYATIPNKNATGMPVQVYVNRQLTPTVTLWPIPDSAMTYTLVYWYLKRIEDTGVPGSNTMDVPWRFLPSLTAGLAYKIAIKKNAARAPDLKVVYEQLLDEALSSDVDRSSTRVFPAPSYI